MRTARRVVVARRDSHARSEGRPRRFPLHLPVWYRKPDEHQWHTGTTQSISISGAIIHADEPITPADPIVIAISLPVVPGCLVGRGRIVRTVANTSDTSGNTFIVAVDRYRISRRDVVLSSPKR